MNAVPNTNPSQNPPRGRTVVQSRVSAATQRGSRYAQWYGSNASPAPIPARAAMTVRRGRLTLPPDQVRRCAGGGAGAGKPTAPGWGGGESGTRPGATKGPAPRAGPPPPRPG